MRISDYDKFDYDYSTYWRSRQYENGAERLAIKALLKNESGQFFLDIGGSYGRLLDTYYLKYKSPIILDYSLKTLQKNAPILKRNHPNLSLIAANVYFMPFKEKTIDGALMVRVLHHIEAPEKYLKQLETIMSPGSIYLQEFANKIHIKATLRELFRFNFRYFSKEPFQQPTQQNYEGSNGQETVFLNFHPRHIKKLLRSVGFRVLSTRGTSFLRIPLLKRFLPIELTLLLEALMQKLFSWTNISPSIILKTSNTIKGRATSDNLSLEKILACPRCKGDLKINKGKAVCASCKAQYTKKKSVWDFRVSENEA